MHASSMSTSSTCPGWFQRGEDVRHDGVSAVVNGVVVFPGRSSHLRLSERVIVAKMP